MEVVFLILISIFSVVIFLFFLGMLIASKVSDSKTKKKIDEIYTSSQLRQKDQPQQKPSDEFKARDERKEIVTGKAVSKEYEKFQAKEEDFQEGLVKVEKEVAPPSETVIVDIAKPVGFWSRLIMSQKLGFMMAMKNQMNKNNKHGYFVNLIKAQSQGQSKEKGRGL